jgi:hypothetical protein
VVCAIGVYEVEVAPILEKVSGFVVTVADTLEIPTQEDKPAWKPLLQSLEMTCYTARKFKR